jgi:ankyrin repeat protein
MVRTRIFGSRSGPSFVLSPVPLVTVNALACLLLAVTLSNAQPLHSAAFRGDADVVSALVKAGANVDVRDSSGVAALHHAARMGHVEVIAALVAGGADVDIRISREGTSPLHLAAASGHVAAARILLDADAEIDQRNGAGQSPLHWAIENGRTEVVGLLLDRGADIEARDSDGFTTLHRAVVSGYSHLVVILLDRGARPGTRAGNGLTPMRSALNHGYIRTARLLRLAGATFQSREDLVLFVQNQLWLRGYGVVEVDGVAGTNTLSAIRAYQRHAELDEDGVITDTLADHLASSGEIGPYLAGDPGGEAARTTVTNIFVSWYDFSREHGWEPGFLWARGQIVGEGKRFADRAFRGAVKYTGHVRFGRLEIDGGVWVLSTGWVVEHGSKIYLLDPGLPD